MSRENQEKSVNFHLHIKCLFIWTHHRYVHAVFLLLQSVLNILIFVMICQSDVNLAQPHDYANRERLVNFYNKSLKTFLPLWNICLVCTASSLTMWLFREIHMHLNFKCSRLYIIPATFRIEMLIDYFVLIATLVFATYAYFLQHFLSGIMATALIAVLLAIELEISIVHVNTTRSQYSAG